MGGFYDAIKLDFLMLFKFPGKRPTNLGVTAGKLTPCPGTPNCVCSQSDRADEQVESLPPVAIDQLRQVIETMERTTIVEVTDTYLYAEFESKLMGYVDDVEFYLDTTTNVMQVRSASRLGKSDLGVNRQRVEAIRGLLAAQ